MRSIALALLLLLPAVRLDAEPPPPGLFVAVGYGGRRLSSTDGVVWDHDQRRNDEQKDNDDVLFGVTWGLGRFLAVGGGARTGWIASTTDGARWEELPAFHGRVAAIAFGQGRFVAAHDAELLSSTDGASFIPGERLDWKASVHARRMACGDTEAGFFFVVIGDVDLWGEQRRVSWRGATLNGARWDHRALDTVPGRDLTYGAGIFVVVGPAGRIETSHDGQTWVRREFPSTDDLTRVVWTGARFLASNERACWSSPDAVVWQREPVTLPCAIAWAREEPSFLAIGFSWGGNLWTSHSLNAWSRVPLPAGPSLQAIAFGQP
jgi:hypothetical protein